MIQVLQHLRSGQLELAEVPDPRPGRGSVLIRTRASVISAGTERMLVEFSKANLIQKARQQPERVQQVLDKIRTDGLMPTLEAVFRKLDEPLPLGYCNAGVVVEVGPGVHDLHPGDRVPVGEEVDALGEVFVAVAEDVDRLQAAPERRRLEAVGPATWGSEEAESWWELHRPERDSGSGLASGGESLLVTKLIE